MPAATRKRVKKSRRRTTATQDSDDSSSSSSSSSSDSETEERQRPFQVDRRAAAEQAIASSSSSSESSSSSSSDEEAERANVVPEKRHRKRSRKGKVEAVKVVSEESSANSAKPAALTATAKDVEEIRALGDPSKDDRLNDTTVTSLAYAQQYHTHRALWKFNKARQEHLIRHMTSRPDDIAAKKDDGEEEEEQQITKSSGWPDEWNRCVALYLSTVQGAAKERLVQRLRQSAQQTVPVVVENKAPAQSDIQSATTTKSVSFGDMAMEMRQDQDAASTNTVEERERIQFERERARSLLTIMGQSFY